MVLPLFLTASTAIGATGLGVAAMMKALREGRGGLAPCDFEGVRRGWMGKVRAADTHALPDALAAFDCRNNRLADLALRQDGFLEAVEAAKARHGARRVGLAVGTSTSGVGSGERAYAEAGVGQPLPDWFDHRRTQDLSSLLAFTRAALGTRGPGLVISTACSSTARAVVDAWHLIAADLCDAAVVGGADSLCRMTLEGFAALDLVSEQPCRPCDAGRTGVSIGEAAGFLLLEREGPTDTPRFIGHGESSDGHHMSAPHPEGLGAQAAMRQALAGMRPETVDWIKLHGTGTRANDAAEDAAVTAVFGPGAPCSSLKGWLGHTLGACGVVEAVLAAACLREGWRPGTLGLEQADPAFSIRLDAGGSRPSLGMRPRRALLNAFGFGGSNCSLLLETGR